MSDSSIPSPRLGDRSLFPQLEARAYLAHAAISPASVAVEAAVTQVVTDYQRRGVRSFPNWAEQREQLRHQLGCLINGGVDGIALTAGTTRGITDLALSIPWNKGDRVLCFRGEFPANVTPWQRAAELFGLEVTWLDTALFHENEDEALSQVEATLRRGVRLVAVSAVQFQSGLRMPLEKLGAMCRAHDTELAVDAIQACGVIPVDVVAWGADYLVCGAHKWLMGLEGCGFLWVRPELATKLRTYTAGWLSHEHGADFLFQGSGFLKYDRPFKRSVAIFEGSTSSAIGFAALGASVSVLLELGIANICAHVQAYLDELERELVERGFTSLRSERADQRSGTLSVDPPSGASAVALQAKLTERGIIASVPDGHLRFAPHWPNHPDEIADVLAAIDGALG